MTRVNKVQDTVVGRINQRFQTLLKGSVWANYELVSTQWLLFEDMTPNYLANTVQETYLQYPHPDTFGYYKLKSGFDVFYYTDPRYNPFAKDSSSSSCMGCHYTASSVGSTKVHTADFSFILGEAH